MPGRTSTAAAILTAAAWLNSFVTLARAQLPMEKLGRGVVAMNQGDGNVYVGWRFLGTDPDDVAFNVYRAAGGDGPVKLNAEPIRTATNLLDAGADLAHPTTYSVWPVTGGGEGEPGRSFTLPA